MQRKITRYRIWFDYGAQIAAKVLRQMIDISFLPTSRVTTGITILIIQMRKWRTLTHI